MSGVTSIDRRPAMSDELLTAALDYATAGLPVFPLKPRGKAPLTGRGFHEASADVQKVAAWWDRYPDANIGIPTGAISDYVVLDSDVPAGLRSLAELERRHGALTTARVLTGSGGYHDWFKHPGRELPNSAGQLGEGLDVRGDGGYIVAPPSVHESGNVYKWTRPLDQAIDCPAWLLDDTGRRRNGPAPAVAGAIPEGTRNATLASLAGTMRRRGMDEPAIRAALLETNRTRCEPPLPDRDVERIAHSISSRYAPAEPGTFDAFAKTPSPADTALSIPCTDLGNAERLVHEHGKDLRFAPGLGWLAWDGRRWKPDRDGEAIRRAKLMVRSMYAAAGALDDADARKKLTKWALDSESEARLRAAVSLASTERPVIVAADQIDADPWLFNAANGTIDLRTGELREHRREDLLSRVTTVVYDPEARSELWDSFLERVVGGDAELAGFLQRAAGYSLTGITREDTLFFVHGPTATGKSSTLEAIRAALSSDYAMVADFETFLKRRGDSGIRNDVARLRGARLVVSVEVDEGKQLAEGLIKAIVGGDRVTARHLYCEAFEFEPTFKLWLVANERPRVKADDAAMWRRILQIPFLEVIPEAERDERLRYRLRTDPDVQTAILAWAVTGCLQWQQIGLAVPQCVRDYTDAYRSENDPLRDWLTDNCEPDPDAWTSTAELRQSYENWCEQNRETPVSARKLGALLEARGYPAEKATSGTRGRRGLRVR